MKGYIICKKGLPNMPKLEIVGNGIYLNKETAENVCRKLRPSRSYYVILEIDICSLIKGEDIKG